MIDVARSVFTPNPFLRSPRLHCRLCLHNVSSILWSYYWIDKYWPQKLWTPTAPVLAICPSIMKPEWKTK